MNTVELEKVVNQAVNAQPIFDLHTHLYPPTFGTPLGKSTGRDDPAGCMLWGMDELLTYHYLIAEVFRTTAAGDADLATFWRWNKRQQAEFIWEHLFIRRTPISEACRGVVTVLGAFGVDPAERSLGAIRDVVEARSPSAQIDRVLELAGVDALTMTNNVFDDNERNRWLASDQMNADPRFRAVLRIDPMLVDWPASSRRLAEWGYAVNREVDAKTVEHAARFLRDWIARMKPAYIAASLPPQWRYPAGEGEIDRAGQQMLDKVVLPVCRDLGLPMALMIGATRQVNPDLRDAGDSVGLADVTSLQRLCRANPDNRFLVTMLARENQHALAVASRKFANLTIFGCWWFLNTPSLIEEITRMRLELLGATFIPQHSDARILEQLVYKWRHSRKLIAGVLAGTYRDLLEAGWRLTEADVRRDVALLLSGNARAAIGGSPPPEQAGRQQAGEGHAKG